MGDKELEGKLYDLLATFIPKGRMSRHIDPEMTLRRDLGMDSVQILMLLFKFEQEFGVELPGVALSKGAMTSVGELVRIGVETVKSRP